MSNRTPRAKIAILAAGLALFAAAPTHAQTAAPAPADSLTFHGVTLYGTVDLGMAYLTHGAPLSAYYGPGLPFLIQKFNNKPILSLAPNGLSQSKIGLSGVEPIGGDWTAVFRLETGFQPTSLRLTDGPRSLERSNGMALSQQADSGDSARAGQAFNAAAYAGLSSRTWGAITYGRQTSLMLDNLIRYDPQAQSQSLSPIGYSGVAGGGGDTADTRLDRVVKYAYASGPVRVGLLHQFGAAGAIPGGADQADVGGDYAGFAVDLIYSRVSDAVTLAALSAAQNLAAPGTLAATISDNTAYSAQGKYTLGPAKLFAGYEHIAYANPAHPLAADVTDIGGYTLSTVNNAAYANHKVLQIAWTGVRYSLTPSLELSGAYYRYDQNSYKGNGCANTSASSCSGTMNALSAAADYRLTRRFDVYAGLSYSGVQNGLASGFLQTATLSPIMGVRFNF